LGFKFSAEKPMTAFTVGPGLSCPAENTQKSFQILFFNIFILVGITIRAPYYQPEDEITDLKIYRKNVYSFKNFNECMIPFHQLGIHGMSLIKLFVAGSFWFLFLDQDRKSSRIS
jgi:hypothetical protein